MTSNQWEPDKFEIAPTVVGSGGIFPTIFGVLREQRPSAILACFHDWDTFARLLEPDAPDIIQHGDGPINTTEKAIDYFKSKRPNFTFIHLDHVDHAGHTYGHGSAEYYLSVQEADRLVGEIVRGLEEAEILNQSILLVSADHGGVGTKHGNATTAEIEIPWIIAGPGIVSGHKLTSAINTYDTAATVAYIFGVKPPHAWIGRPVLEAFLVVNSGLARISQCATMAQVTSGCKSHPNSCWFGSVATRAESAGNCRSRGLGDEGPRKAGLQKFRP